jgi:hypothetical protein
MVVDAPEEWFIPIQTAKILQKTFLHPERIESFGLISCQQVSEVTLQAEGGVKVAAILLRRKIPFHFSQQALDLIPAFVKKHVEKRPRLCFEVADVDAPESKIVEPSFVKGVEFALTLKHFARRSGVPLGFTCPGPLELLDDGTDGGIDKREKKSLQFPRRVVGIHAPKLLLQRFADIEAVAAGIFDVFLGVASQRDENPIFPATAASIAFAEKVGWTDAVIFALQVQPRPPS